MLAACSSTRLKQVHRTSPSLLIKVINSTSSESTHTSIVRKASSKKYGLARQWSLSIGIRSSAAQEVKTHRSWTKCSEINQMTTSCTPYNYKSRPRNQIENSKILTLFRCAACTRVLASVLLSNDSREANKTNNKKLHSKAQDLPTNPIAAKMSWW